MSIGNDRLESPSEANGCQSSRQAAKTGEGGD